jgi:hypothetical protein
MLRAIVFGLVCLLATACDRAGGPAGSAGADVAPPDVSAPASDVAPDAPPAGPADASADAAATAPDAAPDAPTDAPAVAPDAAAPFDVPDAGGPLAIVVREGPVVVPQTNLHLEAPPVPEGAALAWEVRQPVGSRSVFLPSAAFARTTFEANVAGTYVFSLRVFDAQTGAVWASPAPYEVTVVPCSAVHVELLWHTPGDDDETDTGPFAGADLDLHLVHPRAPSDPAAPDQDGDGAPDPWFDQPFDCY